MNPSSKQTTYKMKKNLNPYPEQRFEEQFKKTDVYARLEKDFDIVSFEKFVTSKYQGTPRENIGKVSKTKFSAVPFYYLGYLLEKNPREIYDLGCGWNIFKKYIPTIIGVGAEHPDDPGFYADIHDFVDDDYILNHQNFFESVFSINALHFQPLSKFGNIVNDFYSMIQPGGRGFIAFNLARMIERDPRFMINATRTQYEEFLLTELEKLSNINFLVVDVDLHFIDEGMDGNIRLVMEK